MKLGLRMSLSIGAASAAGGGGGSAAPASMTHLVRPSAMTFSGGNLTGITDEVAASSTYFTQNGTLPGNTTTGLNYGEERALSDWVSITGLFDSSTGKHFAIRLQKDADLTPTVAALMDSTTPFAFIGYMEDGSVNTAINNTGNVAVIRVDEVDYTTGVVTRNQLWDAVCGDQAERVVLFKDLRHTGPLRPLKYASAGVVFNGDLRGWARFTDWAEADDVAAYLLS